MYVYGRPVARINFQRCVCVGGGGVLFGGKLDLKPTGGGGVSFGEKVDLYIIPYGAFGPRGGGLFGPPRPPPPPWLQACMVGSET